MTCDAEELRGRLLSLGFDAVRFAAAGPTPAGDAFRSWWEAGHAADMDWIGRSLDKRRDPSLVLPDARTVILLGVNYGEARKNDADGAGETGGEAKPQWARYALHEDYHDTVREGLVAAGRVLEEMAGAAATDYRYYVDTGPVLERSWAAQAGMGFVGKNAMLISRDFGNWLFLAAIITRVVVTPDEPIKRRVSPAEANRPTSGSEGVGLLCGKCTRCLDACPTQAFPSPGVLDARRCISYQTIENRGIIPRELRRGIGHRIYGCDVCAEVCPWNRFAQDARAVLITVRGELADLTLRELLGLTPESFARIFRKTAVKRLKLRGLLRNACIVAGNLGAQDCLPTLLRLATLHPEAMVRAHAVWAVRRLEGDAQLVSLRATEQDPGVLAEFEGPV